MNIFLLINKILLKDILIIENLPNSLRIIKPVITIIITVYNQAHCLHTCIRSIQNQSIKNLEIIIIDDCSLDNSIEIIKEYQKFDKRIICIEHDTNEGVIKSRTDGIKRAKGRYITIIDGDDALIHKDILKNSLYIANKAHLDIIEFQAGVYKNGKLVRTLKNYPQLNLKNIVYQPQLKTIFINVNNSFPDDIFNRAIWGKLIKKTLFNKMLDEIGIEYTDDFINYAEDTIMVITLLNLAKSYYLMNEKGYLYSLDKIKNVQFKHLNKTCKIVNKIKNFDYFKFLKFLVDKRCKEENDQKIAYREIISINYERYLSKIKMDKRHYKILFYILTKALQFEFLNKKQKNVLGSIRRKIMFKKNKENIY